MFRRCRISLLGIKRGGFAAGSRPLPSPADGAGAPSSAAPPTGSRVAGVQPVDQERSHRLKIQPTLARRSTHRLSDEAHSEHRTYHALMIGDEVRVVNAFSAWLERDG